MTTIQTSTFACDAYTQLAMMATQVDEQDRTIARQTEDAADAAADESEEKRVEEMRAQAQDAESAALVSGITSMAGGLCSFFGAFVSSGGSASGGTVPSRWGLALDAGSKIIPSVGGVASSVYTSDASGHGAAAEQDEANAKADLSQATRAHDDLQAARSSLDKVTQFLDETQQAENAARLAAVSVRA